jgi:hypothetical protein
MDLPLDIIKELLYVFINYVMQLFLILLEMKVFNIIIGIVVL